MQLSENITKCLLFIILHIFLLLILQSTCSICITWKLKPWNNSCTLFVNEQNQVTSHSNWPRVLLFDVAHKQCNDVIKWWHLCLTSESKGRFLVDNKLFGSAWCLAISQIQFCLMKKIKIGRSEHSLASPQRPITSHFYLQWL